jgi:transposase InsO family protein
MVFRFIEREKASHSVRIMCRLLGVSPSGFWAWLDRKPSARIEEDARLLARISRIHRKSRGTYGAPRIRAALRDAGEPIGMRRTGRLMRLASLRGVTRRKFRPTTRQDPSAAPAPDLVRRQFHAIASRPDRLWVSDITELPTREGKLYLATILDACSRRIVGWSMADHMRTSLVLDALEAALAVRRRPIGLIYHSDRGSQFTSAAFRARLEIAGIAASMGAPGTCYDNAMAESFFATLETELIDRSDWATRAEARLAVFEWIEIFYNRFRIHSRIGYQSPAAFERRWRAGSDSDAA